MSTIKISALTQGTPLETDIIPYVDLVAGQTKKALKSDLKGLPGNAATVNVGTTTTGAPGTNASVTNIGTIYAAILDFVIPRGDVGAAGATGATGKGITSIAKTGTVGLVDTYTITYSDATTSTFTVTNGATGATGKGITSIVKTGTVGLVDTYTITYSDTTTSTFTVTNGSSFTWKDAYNPATAYVVNDVVYYNGSSYINILASTGIVPTNTTYWSLVAQKGIDGTGSGDFMKDGSVAMTGNFNAGGKDITNLNQEFFNTSPTITAVTIGKMYWDTINKTLATDLSANVTLQHGQEIHRYVYNGTASTITNGSIVYQSGNQGVYASVSLAKADADSTSVVAGVATEDIAPSSYGYITVLGEVHGLNTNSWTIGTRLYLSDTTAGTFTSTAPQKSIIVGVVTVQNISVGSIFIKFSTANSLESLTDTLISSPITGNTLQWNGSKWVNGPAATASSGPGVSFYNDDTSIIGVTTNNVNPLDTFSKVPVTTTAEVVDAYSCANNTVFGEAYLNGVLGRTSIDAGTWIFNTWCGVSSTAGGRISSLSRNVFQVISVGGTITTTGTGTTRTATVTGSTPFVSGDFNASMVNTGFLQTPQGLYQIVGYTSSSVVTIATPSTYANETGVSNNWLWRKLFGINTGTITAVAPNYSLITTQVAQPAFTINATDKLGSIVFATSNNTTTVNFLHNGSLRYSFVTSPLVTSHQDLALLQGGSSTERYHLTSAQATVATQSANGSQNGYLSSTDWTTFNGKISASSTDTLTNKRITPRLVTATSYTTDTGTSLNCDTTDQFEITAQAGALLFNAPGGTPTGGQKLIIRIKDNGTAMALTYNAIFRALGTALPSTTVISKTLYMGFIYNATDSKWDLVAVAQET